MPRVCDLDKRTGSFSSDNDSFDIEPSSEIQLYARMEAGAVTKFRVLTPQCAVTTKQAVIDLGLLASDESVSWLAQRIDSRAGSDVIEAIAVHDSPLARDVLINTAAADNNYEDREDAVFWMGQVRFADTVDVIKDIMFTDKDDELREHALFVYSESNADDILETLATVGKQDRSADVRSAAWFWLAQSATPESEQEILHAIKNDRDADVREDAVFALSELPEDRAVDALALVLENKKLSKDLREEALFWLAELESDVAIEYIDTILSGSR
jgi:HEAT repeat protein